MIRRSARRSSPARWRICSIPSCGRWRSTRSSASCTRPARQGELTPDQLGAIWLETQSESLGPAIELKPGYEVFWAYVPHFVHSPFYVYAYAFGDCLVNSLYGLYDEAHPGFVNKYFDMLKAGGSKHHSELLAPFGLDASKPEFWNKGLKVIEGMIDELAAAEGGA